MDEVRADGLREDGVEDGDGTAADHRLITRLIRSVGAGDHGAPQRVRGDHDLNAGFTSEQALRDAAVLVGVIPRYPEPTILFTQRTAHLAAHAGQISFPGGRVEPDDRDAEDTALREACEEIGLDRNRVEVIGRLDTYMTRTGFRVTPVVGLVRPPFTLEIDPVEVAEAFEVPLSVFVTAEGPERHARQLMGKTRYFYAFPYQHRFIWGATAGMLVNLREWLLAAEDDANPR